ncbi:MAG: hypothetical protein HY048_18390 [Acidobacteria bacterium]|nr:hypothetical protein [Acidobacteriota bacterium]
MSSLLGEVPVQRARAVLDALGDLADRNVLKALADEQIAGGVENRSPDGLAISLLSFFDTHEPSASGNSLNSVHQNNIVRRRNIVLDS